MKEITGGTVEKGDNYVEDPSGLRTGNPPDEKMAEILNREVRALEGYIHKVIINVGYQERNIALTYLKERFQQRTSHRSFSFSRYFRIKCRIK